MLVYDVEAKDSDRNDNGIIDYGFYVNGVYTTITNEFRINPITGVIRAEKVYDRETRDRYLVMKDFIVFYYHILLHYLTNIFHLVAIHMHVMLFPASACCP